MKTSTIITCCLVLATVVAGQGTLKEHIGAETHWLMVLIPLTGAMVASHGRNVGLTFLHTVRKHFLIGLPWALLIVTILIAVVANDLQRQEIRFSLVTCFKLAVLLACLYALLSLRPTGRMLEIALKVLLTATTLAFAISLVVPEMPVRFFARIGIGWLGAVPGVFWKSGIFLMPLLAYRCLSSSDTSTWLWLALASMVVALDGTRTGLLLEGVILVGAFIVCGLMASFRNKQLWLRFLFILFVILIFHIFVQPFVYTASVGPSAERATIAFLVFASLGCAWWLDRSNAASLTSSSKLLPSSGYLASSIILVSTSLLVLGFGIYFFAASLNISGSALIFERSMTQDTARLEQILLALDRICENFLFGGGLGTTRIERHHVHMVYLQLFADIGIFGLFAYLGIFLVAVGRISKLYSLYGHDADTVVVGAGVVLVYMISGAFHPFSNEISEWFIILIAFAVLSGARTKVISVKSEAPVT